MTDPQFFIYFHRRPDTGDVFYVGRGKRVGRGSPVKRAHAVRGRSAQWQSIVEKNGGQYAIEIVEWCDTFEFAKAREQLVTALGPDHARIAKLDEMRAALREQRAAGR